MLSKLLLVSENHPEKGIYHVHQFCDSHEYDTKVTEAVTYYCTELFLYI